MTEASHLTDLLGSAKDERVESGQRLSSIQLDREWDAVIMVILDPEFEASEI
jgi:hypothetical protein